MIDIQEVKRYYVAVHAQIGRAILLPAKIPYQITCKIIEPLKTKALQLLELL